MKLRSFLCSLVILGFAAVQLGCFAAQSSNSTTRILVNKYRAKNYLGCIQYSDELLKTNPSNVFAHYYRGLSYTQLGKTDEAISSLESVTSLNTNSQLSEYAAKGLACLRGEESCKAQEENDLDAFINSNKFYHSSVQSEVNSKRLDRMKNTINEELRNQKSDAGMPSNDEIANAVKTLAKVGINPIANQMSNLYAQNPEMMQMNMLLGNNYNQNNNMMNMLPMLMMNQSGDQKVSPELIQTMMMSQLSPDFGAGTY